MDDELSVRESLRVWLKKSGYAAEGSDSGKNALERLAERPVDVVFLDIKMPGMDGIETLHRIKEVYPSTQVVMMTAYGSVESSVQAMKMGASDYLMKPLDPDQVDPLILRLMQRRELIEENLLLRERLEGMDRFENLIGRSQAMQQMFEVIRDVAPSDSSVLITGETGTGKEMVARTVHALSSRGKAPFMAINCGAFSEHLLESELFGHEKGAFTGAVSSRKGRIELCGGGTLFLDEMGAISTRMQVDLLRVLEEKQFYRVGGQKPVAVDFRLIAATNQDLQEAVGKGTFRADLFYRLNVISIHVPPLRERVEDIPLLAQFFLERFRRDMKKDIESLSHEAMDYLCRYEWPGNVRELQNAMERVVVLGKRRQIGLNELAFLEPRLLSSPEDMRLERVIRDHLERALKACGGNISEAARMLGIHRSTLHKKIRGYGIG